MDKLRNGQENIGGFGINDFMAARESITLNANFCQPTE